MLFLDCVPAPPLDAFIASIWYCENESRPYVLERVLPSGSAQLIVNLKEDQTLVYRPEAGYRCETAPGAVVRGMQSRYSIIDSAEQESVLGVSFRPRGTVPFLPVPAHEMCDANIPLDIIWGARAPRACGSGCLRRWIRMPGSR